MTTKRQAHEKYQKRRERLRADPAAYQRHLEIQRERTARWKAKQTYEARYARHLLKHYGLSLEGYMALYAEQGGKCAICGRPYEAVIKAKTERLYVDHDHGTNTVRGLLCHSCNTGIGHLRDDPEFLSNAMAYLKRAKQAAWVRYLRIFTIGYFLVALVASNTKQIVGGHYLGAFIVGYLISLLWATGVQRIHHEGLWGACIYATGAAFGTVTAMFVTSWFYGG